MTGLSNAELPGPVERRQFKFKPLFDANFLTFRTFFSYLYLSLENQHFHSFVWTKVNGFLSTIYFDEFSLINSAHALFLQG